MTERELIRILVYTLANTAYNSWVLDEDMAQAEAALTEGWDYLDRWGDDED